LTSVTAATTTPPAPTPAYVPPQPPPAGYQHSAVYTLNAKVIPWIAPVCLVLIFFLIFFSWTGAFPAGYGVYTQSGFQAIWGWFSTDSVGDEVLKRAEDIHQNISANWVGMLLYFLLVLVSLVLAFAPTILKQTSVRLPPTVQQVLPWRTALLSGAIVIAFLVLVLQLWGGLGLERALTAPTHASFESEYKAANSAEKREKVEIQEAMQIGQLHLRRTFALRLLFLLQLLAIMGIGLEVWLERRGPRPMPRIQVQW
jgi:hypothetical protein